ncbi:MAG: M14 family metallopeptidase [Chloroflexota bacterium]
MPTVPLPAQRPWRVRDGVLAGLAALILALAGSSAVPVAAAEPGYPPGDAGYTSYPELTRLLAELAAAHPAILEIRSIGRSAQGREIWAARITDHADDPVDAEGEPEVLVDGLHHAREHLSAEVAIDLVRVLVGRYGGTDPLGRRVTRLVDTRVIWVVPMLDPDGLAWDLSAPVRPWGPGGASWYAAWRKNRQPLRGTSAVGVDLNRTWGYRWGCCGGSSGSPSAEDYRGPRPWSAPETRALRDLVLARATDGRPRIRVHASLHATGELVLWPWAYTRADRAGPMTPQDLRAFRALGRELADAARFRPMQSSALYPSDGDMIDWMYARGRVFSFTVELSPARGTMATPDRYYLPDEQLPALLRRTRPLLLRLIAAAGCPWAAAGEAAAWCGPYYDDLEAAGGWVADPAGTDDATSGRWARGTPRADGKQRAGAETGIGALATGLAPGDALAGGTTTIRSPWIALPADGSVALRLAARIAMGADAGPDDGLVVWIVAEDPAIEPAEAIRLTGDGSARKTRWATFAAPLPARFAGARVAIVLVATAAPGVRVEAAVDTVRLIRPR